MGMKHVQAGRQAAGGKKSVCVYQWCSLSYLTYVFSPLLPIIFLFLHLSVHLNLKERTWHIVWYVLQCFIPLVTRMCLSVFRKCGVGVFMPWRTVMIIILRFSPIIYFPILLLRILILLLWRAFAIHVSAYVLYRVPFSSCVLSVTIFQCFGTAHGNVLNYFIYTFIRIRHYSFWSLCH